MIHNFKAREAAEATAQIIAALQDDPELRKLASEYAKAPQRAEPGEPGDYCLIFSWDDFIHREGPPWLSRAATDSGILLSSEDLDFRRLSAELCKMRYQI